MSIQIDLNADLGEGAFDDEALMGVITSCNIACGGHAGDDVSMREALLLAKRHNVSVGAHPSFPDRENFGRKGASLAGADLVAELGGQVLALKRLADEIDIEISHLKPHGALYNMAADDRSLSRSIIEVLQEHIPNAKLFGPPGSELETAAISNTVMFVAEGFADRAYEADRRLRDRSRKGAVIADPEHQAKQAAHMVFHQSVRTICGSSIAMPVRTICVHGDTPGALAAAMRIKKVLMEGGAELCPLY